MGTTRTTRPDGVARRLRAWLCFCITTSYRSYLVQQLRSRARPPVTDGSIHVTRTASALALVDLHHNSALSIFQTTFHVTVHFQRV